MLICFWPALLDLLLLLLLLIGGRFACLICLFEACILALARALTPPPPHPLPPPPAAVAATPLTKVSQRSLRGGTEGGLL